MKKILSFLLLFSIFFFVGCKADLNKDKCADGKHNRIEWVVLQESTCSSLGTKVQKCLICGEILTTSTISYDDHSIVIDKGTEATCTNEGLSDGKHCSVCNLVIEEQKKINPTGHSYKIDENKSTNSIITYICVNCNDEYQVTNTGNQLCNGSHVKSEWIVEKEATCNSLGSAYKECSVCGVKIEIKSIEMTEHTEKIIEGYDATCTEKGLSDGISCMVCNTVIEEQKEIEAKGHNYQITNTVAPNDDQSGYIEYTCSDCGDSYQKELASSDDYDSASTTVIVLSDDEITIGNDNGGVIIEGHQVTISLPGEYDLIGELSEGSIVVALQETDKATLNLQGVSISSSSTDPIFIESGDEVDISAKSGTINYINDKYYYLDL